MPLNVHDHDLSFMVMPPGPTLTLRPGILRDFVPGEQVGWRSAAALFKAISELAEALHPPQPQPPEPPDRHLPVLGGVDGRERGKGRG